MNGDHGPGRLSPRLDLQPSRPRDRSHRGWRARWRSAEGCRPTASSCSGSRRPSFPAAGAGEKQALRRRFWTRRETIYRAGDGRWRGSGPPGKSRCVPSPRTIFSVAGGRPSAAQREAAPAVWRSTASRLQRSCWVSSITCPSSCAPANMVVTKAGPGAIAEALATSLPLIITGFLPGQESPNVDFVVDRDSVNLLPRTRTSWTRSGCSRKAARPGVRCPQGPGAGASLRLFRHRSRGLCSSRRATGLRADEPVRHSRQRRRSGRGSNRPALTPSATSAPWRLASATSSANFSTLTLWPLAR